MDTESCSDEEDLYTNSVARLRALKEQAKRNKPKQLEEENEEERTRNKQETKKEIDNLFVPMSINIVDSEEPVSRRTRQSRKRRSKPRSRKATKTTDCDPDVKIISVEDAPIDLEKITMKESNDVIVLSHDSDSGDEENFEMNIKILWRSKLVHRFTICKHETFEKIFQYFADLEKVPIEHILIMRKNKSINRMDTPASLNLSIIDILEGGIVKSRVNDDCQEKIDDNMCTVKVQTADRKSLTISLKRTDQFKVLIADCANQLGLKESQLKLYFDGEQIDVTDTPESLEFEQEACIDLKIARN